MAISEGQGAFQLHNLASNIIHLFHLQLSTYTFANRLPHQNSVCILCVPTLDTILAEYHYYDSLF
jgi:hypothetical protein